MIGLLTSKRDMCRLSAILLGGFVLAGAMSCSTAPQPFLVHGPGTTGSEVPTLEFLEPIDNFTRGQGDRFVIRWVDTDRDSNAQISFHLVNSVTNDSITLVEGIDENFLTGPDSHSVSTELLPVGTYFLQGIIDDGVNSPVTVFATTEDTASERVILTITPEGAAPPTVPPIVAVVEPSFNLSVAQDDALVVVVQPTDEVIDPGNLPLNPTPYDPDSPVTLYVVLDFDRDPKNDDPANPQTDSSGNPLDIIVLQSRSIELGLSEAISFEIQIDLSDVPPRAAGEPYYVRATVDDLNNPRVHQYAKGTINVVDFAAGVVDLSQIGKTKSGAKFYGFTPGANLGSTASGVSDFDDDGVADFVLVAQYGNSRNYGLIGEAYLIYGVDQTRFGGAIAANSVSEDIAGAIFEAPPVRNTVIDGDDGSTLGITDVDWIPDVSGDGRPEIIFGLPHVHGAVEPMDYDAGDEGAQGGDDGDNVAMTFRKGLITQAINSEDPEDVSFIYSDVEDTTISSAFPNTRFGSADLRWQDYGDGQREWVLIKFGGILDEIPDSVSQIEIPSVQANLSMRVFNTGGQGTVFQCFTDFDAQTTYATFAENGGDPEVDVDYDPGDAVAGSGLGSFDGSSADVLSVDISDVVRQLLDRELVAYNNEIRLLIAPGEDDEGLDDTQLRSSEWSTQPDERPTLTITYQRLADFSRTGCYPDDLANNQTTDDPDPDHQWFAGGMAAVLHSQNRDNDNVFGMMVPGTDDTQTVNPQGIDPRRLAETVVALELVGQENVQLDREGFALLEPEIRVRADNARADVLGSDTRESGHISGVRFVGGWYDSVDARLLNQGPRTGLFGSSVSSIGDLNNDGLSEFIFSAPNNERYLEDLEEKFGVQSTHLASTGLLGSIFVIPGANYNTTLGRELNSTGDGANANSVIPTIDQYRWPSMGFGSCTRGDDRTGPVIPSDSFEIFAEDMDDKLGGAQSAGDFNQDGLDDILCGAPNNNRDGREDLTTTRPDTGATYILYGSNVGSDYHLDNADDPVLRAPMMRIRGTNPYDRIGWRQETGLDVNGDRIDDVFISSPFTDFGGVVRTSCANDFNGDGEIDFRDLQLTDFTNCQQIGGDYVFSDDPCIAFDYDYDHDVDADDAAVFLDLYDGEPDACENLVENGFVAIIFGGVFLDGDRSLSQIATSDLPGTVFYGSAAGHRAGYDVSSAGDFNQDGFGDLLIAAPGVTWTDDNGRDRLGVVYLIFGGPHLDNKKFNLSQVGTDDLRGIVFTSPYVKGRPNEAAPEHVAFLGDINNDGFGDICIGNPKADFIDLTYPQGPDAPGDDPSVGRRSDAGDAYIIYGNNFGPNRGMP